jgi:hypothetical protein
MSTQTTKFGLLKMDPATDGNQNFNIETMLNENWDKLDSQVAPLNSPEFTGIPKALTAAAGTNTTQLATTAFVMAAIAALVASSPAALDTLNELAAALGNDANFAATITSALALKAPLASPALTGTPTAPTAAAATNNTQIATTAFVKAAISALVNSSPAALDTLNELATALGNDPNFATTMTNALALKAPLASPALTGTPTAPTATAATNTTQIATTAFVKAQGYLASAGGTMTGNLVMGGTQAEGTAQGRNVVVLAAGTSDFSAVPNNTLIGVKKE